MWALQGGDPDADYDATLKRLNVLLTERAPMYAQADICVPIDSGEPTAIGGAGAAEAVFR